jgi:hypothetical protein
VSYALCKAVRRLSWWLPGGAVSAQGQIATIRIAAAALRLLPPSKVLLLVASVVCELWS